MTVSPPRVGLFGLLGSGNIGNDASMESVLDYLRTAHPDAKIDAMCMGPERLRRVYGIEAIPLFWSRQRAQNLPRPLAVGAKLLGKFIDVFRTAAWVRRHDVIIVPGMGVLETTLPLRASGLPYAIFLLSASGRMFGTKVALISVGANVISQRMTAWFFNSAARLAYYRSYRDAPSREAMRLRGLDISDDPVYPDLAFALAAPAGRPGHSRTVGIGVMDFHGTNDDRARAEQIYGSYVEQMKLFVLWLVDNGRTVRLFIGDTSGRDQEVVTQIQAFLRDQRPDMNPAQVQAEPVASFDELMRSMAEADAVVATRYHNLIGALLLGKPTIAIGYAAKHQALMDGMGMPEFHQPADGLDSDLLITQFTELLNRSAELRARIVERDAVYGSQLARQWSDLSALLFPEPLASVQGPAVTPGPHPIA
jgi:polysaccharide pyruvyl transferase WcaK-like protein